MIHWRKHRLDRCVTTLAAGGGGSQAARGDLDGVDGCLRAHPRPTDAVNEADKHRVSALEYASWRGHHHMADLLLRRGADPNR